MLTLGCTLFHHAFSLDNGRACSFCGDLIIKHASYAALKGNLGVSDVSAKAFAKSGLNRCLWIDGLRFAAAHEAGIQTTGAHTVLFADPRDESLKS